MCSRYMLVSSAALLATATQVARFPSRRPRHNAAPTQHLPVVRRTAGAEGREAVELRWGLVPAWAREPRTASLLINARAETVAEKPAFRESFRLRRCLVPADGFFEWQKTPGGRMPWLFQRADGAPLLFAGLWEHWAGGGAEPFESFTILTTTANPLLAELHDRMPVILPREALDEWLAAEASPQSLAHLLVPFPADAMTRRPVNPRLNNVAHDDPACLEPPAAQSNPSGAQLNLGL